MAVYNSIQLDLCKKNSYKAIPTKQLDTNSRFLRVELLNNGNLYDFNDDVTVILASTRNNETKAYKCTTEDGCVVAPLTSWMLAEEGYVDCEIVLIDTASNSKLSSFAFSICVDESIYNDETISQDENYNVLLQLITDVDTAVKSCESATDKATGIYNTVNEKLESGELKGADGKDGAKGQAATITVAGATQTAAGTPLKVQNIGTSTAAELLFSFPAYSLTEYDYEQIQKQLPIATSSRRGVISVPLGCGISVDDNGAASVDYPVRNIESTTKDIKVVKHTGGVKDGQWDLTFNADNFAQKSELPTKTSELTNDSNFVSDGNYIHTDNNYTNEDKAKLAGLSNYDDTAIKQSIAAKQDKLTTAQLNAISAVSGKQDKLTDTQLNNISAVPNKQDKLSQSQLNNIANVTNKQDKLAVGTGLKLENNVLSLDIETATAQTVYGGDTQ